MKRTLCIIAAVALAATATAAPRMVLPESEFDFGYVPQNAQISHTFWIKSEGDETLKITKVIPGCGCTKAPLERDELAVGDSTRLEIIFSTKRYTSRVAKSPRIESNEGPPHKRVRIAATVLPRTDTTHPIVIKPYKLDISQFGEKVRDEMTFTISNVSDQPVTISLIDRPEGLFDLMLPGEIPANSSAEGTITLHASALEESFEKSITIELDDAANSRFTIPIKRSLRAYGTK